MRNKTICQLLLGAALLAQSFEGRAEDRVIKLNDVTGSAVEVLFGDLQKAYLASLPLKLEYMRYLESDPTPDGGVVFYHPKFLFREVWHRIAFDELPWPLDSLCQAFGLHTARGVELGERFPFDYVAVLNPEMMFKRTDQKVKEVVIAITCQ